MFELAVALIIGVLTLLVIKFLLAWGIVLGSRRKEPERAKRGPVHQRWTSTEQQSPRQRPPEQERVAKIWRHRQREFAAKQFKQAEENEWWRVLEVSPYASAEEIRRSYLGKIKQTHPERVVWLAPEFLYLYVNSSKLLKAAYTTGNRDLWLSQVNCR